MHELSICRELLAQVAGIAREHSAQVRRVHLAVGPLSGAEPGLLERAYTIAVAGTVAEGSRLVIDAAPVRVRCNRCGEQTAASANRLLCAACGDWRTQLVSGDELVLVRVELSKAPGATAAS